MLKFLLCLSAGLGLTITGLIVRELLRNDITNRTDGKAVAVVFSYRLHNRSTMTPLCLEVYPGATQVKYLAADRCNELQSFFRYEVETKDFQTCQLREPNCESASLLPFMPKLIKEVEQRIGKAR